MQLTKEQLIEGIYYKHLFLGYINYANTAFNKVFKSRLLNRGTSYLTELNKELSNDINESLKSKE